MAPQRRLQRQQCAPKSHEEGTACSSIALIISRVLITTTETCTMLTGPPGNEGSRLPVRTRLVSSTRVSTVSVAAAAAAQRSENGRRQGKDSGGDDVVIGDGRRGRRHRGCRRRVGWCRSLGYSEVRYLWYILVVVPGAWYLVQIWP